MDETELSSDSTELESEEEVRRVTSELPGPTDTYFDGRLWKNEDGDPLKRNEIFELPAGDERTRRLKGIVADFPHHGQWLYAIVAETGRADLIRLLLELGACAVSQEEDNRRKGIKSDAKSDGNGRKKDRKSRLKVAPKAIPPKPELYYPPLHKAVLYSHLECVKLLVDQGHVSIDEPSKPGETALMLAAECGESEIFMWLLSRGASVTLNPKAPHARSILSLAMDSGKMDIVRTILDNEEARGANLQPDLGNLPPAARGGNADILDLVLSSNCLPSPTGDLENLTKAQRDKLLFGIESAVSHSSTSCLRKLLPYATHQRPDGSYAYFQGENYLGAKVVNGLKQALNHADDPDLFQIAWETLICAPNAKDHDSYDMSPELPPEQTKRQCIHSLLIKASEHGCLETVKRIIELYEVDVNYASDDDWFTPLGAAADNSSRDFVDERLAVAKYLLENTDVDIHVGQGKIANGASCLAAALYANHPEMVKLLLQHGGPVESIDEKIYQYAASAEMGRVVPVALAIDIRYSNTPLRIMTPEGLEPFIERTEGVKSMVLEWEKDELIRMLDKLQIRKTSEQLLWSDPTRQVEVFKRRRRWL